jgi:CMP-N-acetylneuraminic acid synthetase
LAQFGLRDQNRILIRDRKEDLCGDLVSMNLIIEDDIAAVDADLYIMTHTTNPLISPTTIRAGLERLANDGLHDSLFTVNQIQTRFYRSDGSAVNHDPNNLIRTQDLEPWFEENSCLYYFTRESFAKNSARIGTRPLMMETPPLESLDIDEPHDWALVSALVSLTSDVRS